MLHAIYSHILLHLKSNIIKNLYLREREREREVGVDKGKDDVHESCFSLKLDTFQRRNFNF